MRLRPALPVAVALLAVTLIAFLAFRFVIILRSDMADLLPQGSTPAARLMLDQLRNGPATNMILIGIDGATPTELGRISQAMAASLNASGLFAFVENGQPPLSEGDRQFLFTRRYLLSSVTTPAAFEPPALHGDFQRLLSGLASSAAPLVEQYGLPDPPGAFLAILRGWIGDSPVRSIDGVWFAAARDRALILAQTRADALDLTAQATVAQTIRTGFAGAHPGEARLLLSGPAVFTHEAAEHIQSDVRLVSVVSALLIAALLIWRFRSPLVIAAIAVPIVLSIAIAALVVQLVFGFVHGIAFGFGMTMLGVTADYPVLLIGHRKLAEAAGATLRRIGATFNLTVATVVLGLAGMLFAGFPGLSQLGLFAVVGVLTAAATTRLLLPPLIVAADLAPVSAGDPARLLRIERLRRWRLWALLPVAAALVYLLAGGGPRFVNDLGALSPVPQRARALDAELQDELGTPDVGRVVVLQGQSADAVLQQEEAVAPALRSLERDRAIGGVEMAARYLPSIATQRARIASLPTSETLAQNVANAQAGTPFRTDAFHAFLSDVAASRSMAPVTLDDLTNPVIEARLRPLLFRRGDNWLGLIIPKDVTAPARLADLFRFVPGATNIDVRAEMNAIVARYNHRAAPWLAFGAVAALIVLIAGTRDARRVARVLIAIAAAVLVTVAILAALGERFSLIHLVSLQFVAGIGLDYALFFSRPQLDVEERARTLRTLVICNAMTLLTFGLLGLCRTPLLRQVGLTTAVGAVSVMTFAFLFAGFHPAKNRQPG